jgi:uncharacterized protein YbjT (DUF2867 family)
VKVIVYGATGMVGRGVLRECLLDPDVDRVLTVGRTPTGVPHPKLRELVHRNFCDYSSVESDLAGYDACFFCLGITSAGMKEEEYARITTGFTLAAAETLVRLNPAMTFIYVSGAGTDSTEQGRVMWARVKGRTENALLRMPFKAAYMFRPGAIEPAHGERSKTRAYALLYALSAWLFPIVRRLFPGTVTTTEEIGRAMLIVTRTGAPSPILSARAIHDIAIARP